MPCQARSGHGRGGSPRRTFGWSCWGAPHQGQWIIGSLLGLRSSRPLPTLGRPAWWSWHGDSCLSSSLKMTSRLDRSDWDPLPHKQAYTLNMSCTNKLNLMHGMGHLPTNWSAGTCQTRFSLSRIWYSVCLQKHHPNMMEMRQWAGHGLCGLCKMPHLGELQSLWNP